MNNERPQRVFEDHEARREAVPLLVGLYGPSGSGKTYSALEIATGVQRVTGGDIIVGDSEARRALHYADRFKFRHVPFGPPFGSLDYLALIRHCVIKGAKVVVIDSFSHEHEGEGGHLDAHDRELDRLVADAEKRGNSNPRRDAYNMQAWIPLKRARTRMIQGILQMGVTLIACFRAKEKVKPTKAGKIVELGWQPIGAEEIFYEMTLTCLLRPGCGGVPSWEAEQDGERPMIKLPAQFRELLINSKAPLSADVGEALARWAAGDAPQIDADTQALLDGLAALAINGVAAEVKAFQGELQKRYPRGHALHARMVAAFNEAKAAVVARGKAATATPAAPKPASPASRHTAIAEQAGVALAIVAAIEAMEASTPGGVVTTLREQGVVDVTEEQAREVLDRLRSG